MLGCGRIAGFYHLGILARMGGVEVAAIAERDAALLRRASREAPAARACSEWRGALADDAVEAVVVCLPSGLHAEAARAAFEAGKDVYLEKPIATSAEDAAGVVRAWRSSGRIGVMGFNQRFHPAVLAARDAVRAGELGTVVGVRIASGAAPRELPEWKRSRASGGGALLDHGSHHADLARFLLDEEPREVSAVVRSVRTEDDAAWMALTMESGITVESRASLAIAEENGFEIAGHAGRLVVDRVENRIDRRPAEPVWGRSARLRRELARVPRVLGSIARPLVDLSFELAIAAFVRAVARREPIRPDPADGERSLAVVLAAETSAREGRRVRVPGPAA